MDPAASALPVSGLTGHSKPTRIKSILHNVTLTVTGRRAQEHEDVPIKLSILALELNYGPCIDLTIKVDVPCEMGWSWDDHPLLHCRARQDQKRTEPVTGAGEMLDDTPAVRAMLAELCDPAERKLYTGTDSTHRARLIAALEMFWS
jgi:hypothetical protein